MISICIPTYNYNVTDLVEELLAQSSNLDCEIIVIDDASNPSFVKENSALSDRVNFVCLEQNIGRAKIRNLFLEHVQFEYMLFLDCDSLVMKADFISSYLQAARENNVEVVCGGRVYPNESPSSKYNLRWRYGIESESKTADIRNQFPYRSFMTNNFLIRKDTLQRIKFDEDLTRYGHEDTLFGYELKTNGVPIVHIENPILNGHLETNEEFLDKTKDGIYNLVQIVSGMGSDEMFFDEVRLLSYYNQAKKKGRIKRLKIFHSIIKKGLLKRLRKGNGSIKQFNFFKLMTLIKEIEKHQNRNSSA